MEISIEYLTAGCNNETGIFDEIDGYLLYASGKNVLVSKIPSDDSSGVRPVTCALPHAANGRIHSCHWIKLIDNCLCALVASDDGFLRFYSCHSDPLKFTCWSLKWEANLGSAVTLGDWTRSVIVAVTVRGEIYLVNLIDGSKDLVRSYSPKKISAVTIGILPGTFEGLFILAALSDSNIRLLTRGPESWHEELSLSGHQNWITSLSVKVENDHVLVLTSSLDKTIRVWKIQEGSATGSVKDSLLELVPQKNSFVFDSKSFLVLADSIALGHENAVYFASFFTNPVDGSLEILSGSSDRSLILWNRGFGGAWKTILQLGDLNGSLGTIGTDHTFSFYGGTIFKGEWIVANASTGSILFWKRSGSEWIPQMPITGHSDKVESITWSPPHHSNVQFLTTASKDQTTRIFSSSATFGYREIARPQIHGYDLKCISITSRPCGDFSNFELISGADEKVLRVFQAPKQFYRKLGMAFDEHAVPDSAELPALGLSNKAGSSESNETKTAVGNDLIRETEGDLVRNSLWPEIDKLYGHNQELCSLAVSVDGNLMATSAKSHLAADAALRLWKRTSSDASSKWGPTFIVPAHSLTVSCLVFSTDSRWLLSVSRDRNFCIISPETGAILCRHEAHSRMIFSAVWVSNSVFVTGSRDKTIKFWRLTEGVEADKSVVSPVLIQTIQFENGITSLSINVDGSILAAGDEIGNIFILKQGSDELNCWTLQEELTVKGGGGLGPADSITDLKWNPSESLQLAVASADNSIRILRFYL